VDTQTRAYLSKLAGENREIRRELGNVLSEYKAFRKACEDMPRSITAEIDSIPGRRIYFNLISTLDFDIALDGLRAPGMNALVSQDGPFIQTHYPMPIWKPSAPSNATNFGFWSPVSSWPLPTQENATGDRVDLSYEVVSGGSQRNFQNLTAPPLFSRPDALMPLPVPTLFNPNEVIQFFPTFENILFDSSVGTPTTGGTLVVMYPGYRIVNL
jgi:hypothetical protein